MQKNIRTIILNDKGAQLKDCEPLVLGVAGEYGTRSLTFELEGQWAEMNSLTVTFTNMDNDPVSVVCTPASPSVDVPWEACQTYDVESPAVPWLALDALGRASSYLTIVGDTETAHRPTTAVPYRVIKTGNTSGANAQEPTPSVYQQYVAESAAVAHDAALEAIEPTNRKLDALWKINEGKTYEFSSVDATAESVSVPSGAKLATLEKLGGASVRYNQLSKNNSNGGTSEGITWVNNNDGTFTINGTATANSQHGFSLVTDNLDLIVGHTYYMVGAPEGGSATTYEMVLHSPNATPFVNIIHDYNGTGGIRTITNADIGTGIKLMFRVLSGVSVNNLIYRPKFFDLTAMGITASTASEAKNKLTALGIDIEGYIPYTTGSIASAEVDAVKYHSKNILYSTMPTTTTNGVTCRNNGDGTYTLNGTANATTFFTVIPNETPMPLVIGRTYRVIGMSVGTVPDTYRINVNYCNTTPVAEYKGAWGQEIGQGVTFTPTSVSNNGLALHIRVTSGVTCNNVLVKPMLTTDLTATYADYVPYSVTTEELPQAIPDLPDYGVGIGSVYNYIDFENKTYHHKIKSVDMGTLTYGYSANGYFYSQSLTDRAVGNFNLMCVPYATTTSTTATAMSDKTVEGSATVTDIYAKDSAYTDPAVFKSAMSGQTLYYELATEEVIDISDVLDDILFEVDGGTITFRYPNDEGFNLPVPTTVEYAIKLNEVV